MAVCTTSFFTRVLAIILVWTKAVEGSYSFFTLGDWGGAALGGPDKQNVYAVAAAMNDEAKTAQPHFIINTGDSFYWCGIQNTTDYQIDVDFVEPYSGEYINKLQFLSVLGNHEYGYSPDAVVEYSTKNARWVMPARYYTKRVTVDVASETYMSMIFIDTSPCVAGYRGSNEANWDPCSTQYPTCSLKSTNDDFEGECKFHSNIMAQDCGTQYTWFQQQLAAVPKDDWLIVVGHHPIDECSVRDFTTALQARGFSMYMNGHTHTLTQYTIDGTGAYVTSGAGALVNTADQLHEGTRQKALGQDFVSVAPDGATSGASSHTYKTVYNKAVAGFTKSTFSSDFSTLRTDFIDNTGKAIHSLSCNKSGQLL